MGRLVAARSTWYQLIGELFVHFEGFSDGPGVWREALLAVLEVLGSDEDPQACWRRLRPTILDRIDSLSGWDRTSRARWRDDIERRGTRYYTRRDGEEIGVIGAKTLAETRWDFIFDHAKRQYGLLRGVLRTIALRNACVDFRTSPGRYPKTIRLRLSEDQNGQTWFLYWRWEIPWPYERKYLDWTPECQYCSVHYLANDLLAWFADREHIRGRDTLAVDLPSSEKEFEHKTSAFPWQLDVAVETQLIVGDAPEVWLEFRGHPVRWVNRTPHRLATLGIPTTTLGNDDQAYRLALEFISALVFQEGHPIRIVTSCGGARRGLPWVWQPHELGGLILRSDLGLVVEYASGSRKALAISLYAEGVNSGSVYYSFLSYYKVIEAAHRGDPDCAKRWINGNLDRIQSYRHSERVAELRETEGDVGDYLYRSCRCAVAHASWDPIADPDNPEDRRRLTLDLPIVRALARKAIEDGLFDEEPQSVTETFPRGDR
jgi:hypothetical protein